MPNYLPAVVDRILSSKTHNALLDTMQRELRIVGVGSFILLRLAPSGEPFYRWIVGPEALNPLVVDENSSFRCSQAAALAVNIVLSTLGSCPKH